jgi:ABC-type lipoprotein export system ATPase subunit/ABC-type antimicrobial peptide transport system permease subunit
MELIRLEDITKTYYLGEVDVPVLKGVSLTIHRGELVALMGASGSGKSTLMNILGCLDRPTSGKFWLDNQDMSRLSPNQRALVRTAKLGFVFQSFNLLPRTTALANVMMPLDYSPRRPHGGEVRRQATILLDRVGLADRMHHEPSQMSGGQQQRVAIARSLVNRPALLLADEPTGNLDSHTSVEILQMFRQLNAEGITVLLVTHDPKVAAYADRVIRIADGVIEGDERNSFDGQAGRPSFEGGLSQFSFDENGTVPLSGDGNGHGNGDDPVAATTVEAGTRVAVAGDGGAAHHAVQAEHRPAPHFPVKSPRPRPALAARPSLYDDPSRPKVWGAPSIIPPTFRTALGALRRNKMRSSLTALGVIIGVSAVIAMAEIGQGSKRVLERSMASMGANNLLVLPGAAASGGISWGIGSSPTLTPADADEIARQCPAVSVVAPLVRGRGQIVYGSRNWNPNQMYGTTPSYLAVRDWENLDEGDMFTERDIRNGSKVCVIGQTLKRELFQDESPIGKDLRVANVSLRVIGVLGRKGANMVGMDQDDILLAPWTTMKFRVSSASTSSTNQASSSSSSSLDQVNSLDELYPGGTELYPAPSTTQTADTPQPVRLITVDQILAKVVADDQMRQAMDQITNLIRERHRIKQDEDGEYADDFNLRDMTEMTKLMASTSATISNLLLAVAAISLFVGGVGIMNIMLVSVTERTREIGLRMAVGARGHHILRQFLVEAVVLCLLGGAIGIGFGRGFSTLVGRFLPTEISFPAIIASVAVSATVGIVFGFYPAWKASRLDPIEALRYE